MQERVLVAVLTGGRSSRMGTPKQGVRVAGRTMLEWVVAAASAAGFDAFEVGDNLDHRDHHLGPLAGIEAALARVSDAPVLAVAVDQPWLLPATLRRVAALPGDAVVPVEDGRLQVTCALYRPACLPVAAALLDSGAHPVTALLDRVTATLVERHTWSAWGEDGRSWFSADTAESVDRGILRYGAPGSLAS